jgi:hypothetical protein
LFLLLGRKELQLEFKAERFRHTIEGAEPRFYTASFKPGNDRLLYTDPLGQVLL